MRKPGFLNLKPLEFAGVCRNVVKSTYGKSDAGLWHEAVAVRRCGRGGGSAGEACEWPGSPRHHACARRQQGGDRKAIAHQFGSLLRSLPGDLMGRTTALQRNSTESS